MRLKSIYITLFFCLTTGFLFAQSARDYQRKFDSAVKNYKTGQKDKAEMIFSSLAEDDGRRNKFNEESQYFLGLIQFERKEYKKSYQSFLQLLNRYPDWNKVDEVYYILANIDLIHGDFASAFSHLNNIKSENLQVEAFKMKSYYFNQEESLDSLKKLHQQFNSDEALAQVLAQKMAQKQFLSQQEIMLLEYLMQTFVLDKKLESRISSLSQPKLKDTYHVAVLLPFKYEKIKKDLETRVPRSHFAVAIYNGIQLAVDSLNNKFNSKIRLHAYDTKHDTSKVKEILQLEELKQVDLIIGPVYKEENQLVTEFCNKYLIGKINLLSKLESPGDSTIGFYYNPSVKNMAIEMARICYDSVATDSIILVANNYEKDSLFVKAFLEEYDSLGGANVTVKTWSRYATMHVKLSKMRADSSMYKGIVVVNSKKNTISNICSFYTAHNLETPLVVPGDWAMSDQFLAYSVRHASVYFVGYGLPLEEPEQSIRETKYLKKFGIPMDEYSIIGYNAGFVFGSYLNKYGKQFFRYIKNKDDVIQVQDAGFNYYKCNSNCFLSTSKYFKNQFTPVE